jgi:hypothetical protein
LRITVASRSSVIGSSVQSSAGFVEGRLNLELVVISHFEEAPLASRRRPTASSSDEMDVVSGVVA